MRTFLLVCLAQYVSMMGSHLTAFGLGVWLYQRTGSTTINGWVALATLAPALLASPMAGALVDRWSPRTGMLVGHAGAGACLLLIAILYGLDMPELWSILLLLTVASAFTALQFPAQSVAMTLLVPRAQLDRANGAMQVGIALVQVLAPMTAGVLLTTVGLGGVLLMDVVTFVFALVVLFAVRIPRLPKEASEESAPLGRQMMLGWSYLRERPGLLGLVMVVAVMNFNLGMLQVLVVPLVLGFADAGALGTVLSLGGLGMVAGGGVLMGWGAPKRRVPAMLGLLMLQGVLLLLGGLQPSVWLVTLGAFGLLSTLTLVTGCSQLVWQLKVPVTLQGRVFAVRRLLAQLALPLAYLIAGPLADRVFEPMMARDGALAPTLGQLLGVGPGRGVGLMFVLLGLLTLISMGLGALSPRLRRLEEELPDATLPHPAPLKEEAPATATSGA